MPASYEVSSVDTAGQTQQGHSGIMGYTSGGREGLGKEHMLEGQQRGSCSVRLCGKANNTLASSSHIMNNGLG